MFRLDASPGDGTMLSNQIEVQVTYRPDAVPPAERGRLVLGRLEDRTWEPVPAQKAEPNTNRVTAMVDRIGLYALYR
jgi:hypothetical protein